jgi:hypothetical protein
VMRLHDSRNAPGSHCADVAFRCASSLSAEGGVATGFSIPVPEPAGLNPSCSALFNIPRPLSTVDASGYSVIATLIVETLFDPFHG